VPRFIANLAKRHKTSQIDEHSGTFIRDDGIYPVATGLMHARARWVCLMIPVAKQLWLAIRSRPRAAGSNLTVSLRAGPELCSETGNRRVKKDKLSATQCFLLIHKPAGRTAFVGVTKRRYGLIRAKGWRTDAILPVGSSVARAEPAWTKERIRNLDQVRRTAWRATGASALKNDLSVHTR
jgi:hypothetical protein